MGSYEGDRSFAPSSLLLDLGNRPPDFAAPFISGVEPLGGHHELSTMGLIDDYSSLTAPPQGKRPHGIHGNGKGKAGRSHAAGVRSEERE